jgi:DNA invertase Pin-like site-specific DNA recombinase
MTAAPRKLNCAIYTRKSTEEGLEQNFNSLDAQREACENFIASQKAEGWVMLPEQYNDGGFSGGNMERPGLKQLIKAIKTGAIDTIVVYKIDRLSRSLADFAKLVEIFDEHKVTFVSVTQSFNTTTSMGRLTLNILLSFAQFEREVSGERVRDKISASRKRGMWMGGMPPLGYDIVSRKLVPNPQEVKIVQEIFRRFSLVPSMATLVHDLRARGVTSKSWVTIKGIQRTGKLVDKGFLYKILNNPVYVGIAAYKGKHYTGEQPAIIDQPVWEKVQANLAKGRSNRPLHAGRADRTSQAPCLLKGLLYSNEGRCFTPGYTRKKDKFYRYYINTDAIKIGPKSCEIQRLPAGDIESVITAKVKEVLQTPEVTAAAVREVCRLRPDIEEYEAINALRSIDEIWNELFPAERAHIVRSLIKRITVRTTGLTIDWASDGMATLITQTVRPKDDLQEAA